MFIPQKAPVTPLYLAHRSRAAHQAARRCYFATRKASAKANDDVKRIKPRAEGTIASVFASLSGEAEVALPARFGSLKRDIIYSEDLQRRVEASWHDLISHLAEWSKEIVTKRSSVRASSRAPQVPRPHIDSQIIPEVDYAELAGGLSQTRAEEVRKRGALVVRGVVDELQALQWLDSIKNYISLNPDVKGFPVDKKAVYELYWSKAQLEARSHPKSLNVQRALLALFNKTSTEDRSTSFTTPLTYCDRLRIREPGDAKFALGPHCDGGSVERWEDATYRKSYTAILDGRWHDHDPWDIGSRPDANMNMYEGPGACGVFRALQGWTSLSHTGEGEGTMKVYPGVKESSAYIMLRPFFKPLRQPHEAGYLDAENWMLDLDSPEFPNSPLGRSQELSQATHPHLDLARTMTTMPTVKPGDQAWWHCDGVHSVESSNHGQNASSVMYIPCVPLTEENARYVKQQRDCFLDGIPPPDFPGGVGESKFTGKGGYSDIMGDEGKRAMGLKPFDFTSASDAGEKELLRRANEILGF